MSFRKTVVSAPTTPTNKVLRCFAPAGHLPRGSLTVFMGSLLLLILNALHGKDIKGVFGSLDSASLA